LLQNPAKEKAYLQRKYATHLHLASTVKFDLALPVKPEDVMKDAAWRLGLKSFVAHKSTFTKTAWICNDNTEFTNLPVATSSMMKQRIK
jgi:hypothetical protein